MTKGNVDMTFLFVAKIMIRKDAKKIKKLNVNAMLRSV